MSSQTRSIFVDPDVDQQFTSQGYVMAPLLTRAEVQALLEARRNKGRELPRDFYPTVMDPDDHYRREIQETIEPIIAPRVLPLLQGYKSCYASFVDKRANTQNGRVPIHQDCTFVDQSKHAGIHVWIPLVDVNEDNGCLQVFPRTHSLVNHICTIPPGPSPYDDVKGLIESHCGIRLSLAAGMGIFFNGRLLHSSEENRTAAERPAVASAYIPRDSKVRLYVRRDGSSATVDVFEVDNLLDIRVTGSGGAIVNQAGIRQIRTEEHVVRPLRAADVRHMRIGRNTPPADKSRRAVSWVRRLLGLSAACSDTRLS